MTTRGAPRLVSIVTPVYNARSYLEETFASVLRQTWTHWEWVVVDDGSTDGSSELIRCFAERDSRVRDLSMAEHSGLAARVRNRGVAEARGELIALLDADDLWQPEKLARQVHLFEEDPDVCAVSTEWSYSGEGRRARSMRRPHRGGELSRGDLLRGYHFNTSSLVIRRTCYEALGGMDERPSLLMGEDREFIYRLLGRYRLVCVPEDLTSYRVRPRADSISDGQSPVRDVVGLTTLDVLEEKGEIDRADARVWRSRAYATQALDNLLLHRAPFRRHLVRAVRAGRAPAAAWLALALAWLPALLLRPLLRGLRRLRN